MGEIQHIFFPRLRKIYLFGNCIDSVENICRLSMPVVEILVISSSDLSLGRNLITSIDPLRKGHWPNAKTLELGSWVVMQVKTKSLMGDVFPNGTVHNSRLSH